MVHYGHYLFRAPVPLALFDPGLDAITGQSIFLEGHRQNTVMFAESAASADFGGLSWLSPALIYQLFAPLIIVLIGHSTVVREREAAALAPLLAMGISSRALLAGKALALLSFSALLLIPLVISCALALLEGEAVTITVLMCTAYFVYLSLWSILTLTVSAILEKRTIIMVVMTGLWLGLSLALPSIAVNITQRSEPVIGKIASDLTMLTDIRKLGDGHNANDPAFQKLRADLLKKHHVERIEDLPINYRGVVAIEGERKLTEVLNTYAESRMAAEMRQERFLSNFGLLTPALAISSFSRTIAGTDLAHYHRFQREAESVRFDFVQGLNHAHVEQLSYQDDINRNKDEISRKRARVDASNWQVINTFTFKTASQSQRIKNASASLQILLLWLVISLAALLWSSGRIKP